MAKEIIGIIGGSGLGDALAKKLSKATEKKVTTPFGKPSSPILLGKIADKNIAFINRHGIGHKLSPTDVPYQANIYALKKLGVTTVIASCAVGSLRQQMQPKNLIIVDQFIDKTFQRKTSFFDSIAAVHCEMANPTCQRLGEKLIAAAGAINVTTHQKGTYVCMEGPQFSTKAEALMHRSWGGDLIGMTAMPEAKLAREAQICYALIALVSDYDSWQAKESKEDKQTLLKEIISNLNNAADNTIKLLEVFLEKTEDICKTNCHCRDSLKLAVWTTADKITKEQRKKISILFK